MSADSLDACAVALQSQAAGGEGRAWVHLLPAGSFSGRDGRGPYRAENAAAIMETSRRLAGRTKMPVDYNHAIDLAAQKGGPSPAAGWIVGLQSRTDGIWGLVEWTASAALHIANREYRYVSPVFSHAPGGRVMAILRASLVNHPNLEQLVALASMESRMADLDTADLGMLRTELELPAEADTAAIVAAIRALKTQRMAAGAPDPAEYVPIGDFVRVTQELSRVHRGVELQTAKMHVDEQIKAGALFPFLREWGVELCSVNKDAFDAFVAKTGPGLQRHFGPSGASAKPPGFGKPAGGLSDTDAHVSAVLGHSPETFNAGGN